MNKSIDALLKILEQDALKIASCLDYSFFENKTILITGASGLIGVNMLASLNEIATRVQGLNVIPVIHSKPVEFFSSLTTRWSANLLCGDLTDDGFLKSLPMADVIIHAAGFGQPNKFVENPIKSLKINTYTTFKLFDKLNANGRFLFISSSDIYNGLISESYSELQIGTTNTYHPRACYVEGKRTGETICNLYQSQNIRAASVRLSLTYGPGTKKGDQRVLPSIIEKGLKGSISLLDSGSAHRAFCYVSDAIELLWYILLYGKQNLYNLGGLESISIKSLALTIGNILNVPVNIPEGGAGIVGAPKDVLLNMERLLSEYPKKQFVSLEEGLRNTIEWHRHLS